MRLRKTPLNCALQHGYFTLCQLNHAHKKQFMLEKQGWLSVERILLDESRVSPGRSQAGAGLPHAARCLGPGRV